MNPNFRNFALWAVIALLLIALFSMFQTSPTQTSSREIPYSQFIRDVDSGRVRDVTVTGNRVLGTYTENGTAFQTYSPVIDDSLMERLQSKNVTIVARPESDGSSGFLSYLGTLLPMFLILGVWLFFMRQMQGGSRGAMGFGKS
jgi:cell division protease FtsH